MRPCLARLILALTVAAFPAGGLARAASPPPEKPAQQRPVQPAPPTPAETRGEIYTRLAASSDSEETEGLVGLLLAAYAESGSDTADLLLKRANKAIEAKGYSVAEKVLDATIAFLPDCAEAWNARATLRYLDGDYSGSMADIAETLKREPRHLGALLGMAGILKERNRDSDALRVYEKVLTIAPHWKSAEDAQARLKAKIAGQSL